MRIAIAAISGFTLSAAIALVAQVAATPAGGTDFHSGTSLEQKAATMLPDAVKAKGLSIQRLGDYPGSYTQLVVRAATVDAEIHQRWQDNFFVVSGDATIVTGGTLVEPHETAPGELRGSRIEGGESHVMHKGDVIHIPANTPHQSIIAPGESCVYYVVKVEEPTARLMPATK